MIALTTTGSQKYTCQITTGKLMPICSKYRYWNFCVQILGLGAIWVLGSVRNLENHGLKLINLPTDRSTNSMGQSPSWEANRSSARQESPHILQNKKFITPFTSARHQSLPCPRSNVHVYPSHALKIHFNIIPHLPLDLPSSLFPDSPPKTCTNLSSPPYMPHAPPILFFSIWSPEQYRVSSTDHKAPHYVVFSIPLTPRPS